MTDRLANFLAAHLPELEAALHRWLPRSEKAGAECLNEALRYTVFPGGKRLRPLFTLLGAKLVGGDIPQALPAACAIEFLHTSSLILDDLPAMDDADLRRGRSTVHRVYGESTALLAALALFNQAYALLARTAGQSGSPELVEELLTEAAHCIGTDGMIGGQAVDLALRYTPTSADAWANRNLKTTALLRLTMTAGALGMGARGPQIAALARFGECLGLSYQIWDDLLDELGECKLMGKPARQDARHQRPSFVTELGRSGAEQLALKLVEEGKTVLRENFGQQANVQLLLDAIDLVRQEARKLASVAEMVS
jgi:geranylgeranyl diphosphate synthase, type II